MRLVFIGVLCSTYMFQMYGRGTRPELSANSFRYCFKKADMHSEECQKRLPEEVVWHSDEWFHLRGYQWGWPEFPHATGGWFRTKDWLEGVEERKALYRLDSVSPGRDARIAAYVERMKISRASLNQKPLPPQFAACTSIARAIARATCTYWCVRCCTTI